MCGILGAWRTVAPVLGFEDALRRIAHRGPDSSGTYQALDGRLWLGHTRLSILDLSPTGAQPMGALEDRVTIVFNGEIYNFRELRAELEAEGVTFRGTSDTEVLLALYLRHGMSILPRLNGIFAFAIHDTREDTLWIARDALGVKPLYYAAEPGGIAFSSELKALLPILQQPRQLDPAALHRYLTFLWCPGDGTPLKGVRKLAPGHAIKVKAGRIESLWQWYQLPETRGLQKDLSASASVEGLRKVFRESVQRQLVADVPVGAFLSGGLDSSSVVAFARESLSDLRCFTIATHGGRDAGEVDDLPYAQLVARHLQLKLDVVEVDSATMARDLPFMVAQLDEPLIDPAPLNVYYISKLARERGMKVLLSGAGGDDFLTGYRRHVALQHEAYWSWLPASARQVLARSSQMMASFGPAGRKLAKAFAHAGQDARTRLTGYFQWHRADQLASLYAPGFRAELGATRAAEPMDRFLDAIPASTSRLSQMLALEQRFFLADHNLTYTDKMGMATGVEIRVPMLDLEFAEFAARIPDGVKLHGKTAKHVLMQAMDPYLPREVIHRRKTGFGAPVRRWMRNELRELVGDVLSGDSVRKRGLFDVEGVQRVIARNQSGAEDASYALLGLLCIELWCRTYLDRS